MLVIEDTGISLTPAQAAIEHHVFIEHGLRRR